MLKKYAILLGICLALILLVVAALRYPGGSQYDKNAVGYDWKNNYLSNLFGSEAVNGADNTARPWAVCGMVFLCGSFALFFYRASKKIPSKTSANIIKYFGVGAMVFAFLAVTPYHDIMVTIAGTCALVSMFYITVFIFTSRLFFFKVLSVVCLLALYCCNYIYYTRNFLVALPVMQKTSLLIAIVWMLCLEHFTTAADFPPKKNKAAQHAN